MNLLKLLIKNYLYNYKILAQGADGITDIEYKVYELVTRHFLACCSRDAKGSETIVMI